MRDINRIPIFLKEFENIWKELPDWRFGQLIVNFCKYYGDPFYLEEEDFIIKLKEYILEKRK